MQLYFAPMTCSLATRITLYEAGLGATFHQVVLASKQLASGEDYFAINPKGQVPALRLEDGRLLTEGPAVLQYVADLAPESGLAPVGGTLERYELQMWLNYISSEIHKQIFYVIFRPDYPEESRAFVREVIAPAKYDFLSEHLRARPYLVGDRFTIADAYLLTTLNWAQPGGIELTRWPVLVQYQQQMLQRPAVARAVAEERSLRKAA
jgi:glutathione S-transferase